MSEMVNFARTGQSHAIAGRGTPEYWTITVDDTTGVAKLMLMPLPGFADTLDVWYTRSAAGMDMVNNSDTPPFDEEYEGYLIEKTVAGMVPADGVHDASVAASARKEAERILRSMFYTHRKMAPPFQSIQWLGHGMMGG